MFRSIIAKVIGPAQAKRAMGVILAGLATAGSDWSRGRLFSFFNVHGFLATTHRVDTDVLVVEGWIQKFAIRAAADELYRGRYKELYTTDGPENGTGEYVNDYQTSASIGAEILKKLGVPEDHVQMAASHVNGRDRTYETHLET